ncbi:hypothetical protein AA313_de0206399 [Arthrobotrys entomopaga]|nr:hypothetical protein AA313_de0206399 [Arthrobotrys entomopaga]
MFVKQLLLGILLVNQVLGQGDESTGTKQSRDQPASPEEISEVITEEAGFPVDTLNQGAPDAGDNDPGMEDDLAAINFAVQSIGSPPTAQELGIPANPPAGKDEDEEWEDEDEDNIESADAGPDDETKKRLNMLALADWSSQQLAQKAGSRQQSPGLTDPSAAGLTGFARYKAPIQPDSTGYLGPPLGDYSWRTSIILNQKLWDEFQSDIMNAYSLKEETPFFIWLFCKTIVSWSQSIETLFFHAENYLRVKDERLAVRLKQQYQKFWSNSYYLTNKDARKPNAKYNVPGLCDPGGFLASPTKAQVEDKEVREQMSIELIKTLFMYEKLAPNEISISEDLFMHTWNVVDLNSLWTANWLRNEFTPLMREINIQLFPNRDLLANTYPRPLGVWKRRELGYYAYWNEKYGKIYKYLPNGFPYWDVWSATQSMQSVPEMPEMLLYGLHATVVGFIRGPVAFLTEMFVDMAFKAWSIAQKSDIGADEDFAVPGTNNRARTIFAMGSGGLRNAAEKNDTTYVWSASPEHRGLDKWDDAAEIAKNQWRDESLRKMIAAERKAKERITQETRPGPQPDPQPNLQPNPRPNRINYNSNRPGFRKTKQPKGG